MIGLVFVSHSRALAESLVELVSQVASQNISIPIAIAGGVGPDRLEFGTDAVEIMEAIQSVYSDDGVLVLMDLGSAILSAEMALELLPAEMEEKILFCSAPLVEGAIAAAVQAGLGSDLETACQEAKGALIPKQEQLGDKIAVTEIEQTMSEDISTPVREIQLTLKNQHGLHARPAARFVQKAGQFDAQIQVMNKTTGRGPVLGNSLNALATLGALQGHAISVIARGSEAEQALAALEKLVSENFGEIEEPPDILHQSEPKTITDELGGIEGIPISEGIALGPLIKYHPPVPEVPSHQTKNPEESWNHLLDAIEQVNNDINKRRSNVAARAGEEQAGIFDAHILILQDPELLTGVKKRIFDLNENEAAAWNKGIQEIIAKYQELDDAYLKARALDVSDVGIQVLYALSDIEPEPIQFQNPVILVAEDLTPTQTAQLDLDMVLGLITLIGGPTSHSAILARSLGIPAISGVPESVFRLSDETSLAIDGFNGRMWIIPNDEIKQELNKRRQTWMENQRIQFEASHQPAVTKDGHQIEVVANVGNLQDAQMALKNHAEGIGLLRTEFLFLTRNTPPSESEQTTTLREIVSIMEKRPVIVRTLDVGGDKPLPYLNLPQEINPFLGVRAIRLLLERPKIFTTQLRGILRAGAGGNIKIMFPMIATLEDFKRSREILEQVHQTLAREGIDHAWPVELGMMVEVPSAALLAPLFARQVDFFSIGTNDLTQYTLAAERGSPGLSVYADALQPSVLSLIHMVVKAAHEQGKWVGVCGELAGDPTAIPALVGLGVDELSMNPISIPRAKAIIRNLTRSDTNSLVKKLLSTEGAEESRTLANHFLQTVINQ